MQPNDNPAPQADPPANADDKPVGTAVAEGEGADEAPQLDPVDAASVDAFAGDITGKLEVNGEPAEEEEENVEPGTTGDEEEEQTPPEGKPAGKEGEEKPADEAEEEPEPVPELKPEPQVEDPGEFEPGDYSFEIKLGDGKTYKVKTQEDADAVAELLDENPDLITAKQFIDFNRNVMRMDSGLRADQAQYDDKKDKFDKQTEANQGQERIFSEVENGMSYLTSSGLIPKVKPELDTPEKGALWATEYKDEPGVKERLEILDFIAKDNTRRKKAGLAPSFDVLAAHNAMQLDTLKKEKVTETKREEKERKARGGMVGGNAPYSQSNTQKGEIVGEGGSLNDLR